MSVTVIGDGAVGLLAVLAAKRLAAKRLGAEQIVLMGRHQARTDLGREFGATDVVSARGEQGITAVRELTGGHGSSAAEPVEAPPLPPAPLRAAPASLPAWSAHFVSERWRGNSHPWSGPSRFTASSIRLTATSR
jgi:hypothetical protein